MGVIFYSTWGHIKTMAGQVKAGVDAVEGCEGVLYQVGARSARSSKGQMAGAPIKGRVHP